MLLGDYNDLEVARFVEFGVYLTSDDGDILMPDRYVPAGIQIGDTVRAFVYRDSEDRLVATTETPLVRVGEFAALTVRDTTAIGAFLDWGLPKDLLLPLRNQPKRVRAGDKVLVYVYLDDKSDRIVATAKWERHTDREPNLAVGDEVQLLVGGQSELGYAALVNKQYLGMLFRNEVFRLLTIGDEVPGYVRQVRPDGKLDVSLQRAGFDEARAAADLLVEALRKAGGKLPLSDKSEPEDIYRRLGMSKKVFKKALGNLYKRGLVQLGDAHTQLIEAE
ncbi:GntR family transcriptional regulator [Hymenobacter busanensis]|uniref:GntR family transcriptional regulator n=1 Tax=Hymenobacter busanensis TaxID=2607656 RepID=A0A7L4ZVP8_9BACT|nr:S1-like domain-containing RNA-binding protein [Hymenobacter busanensis]KAA9332147.1 GntR family transcriptional regulator [Hymenobacter busanensis]QHJ07514.1 GntR family transcriptional regulator [Hymenobacter busanensis]